MQPARIARAPKISFRHHLRLLTSSQQQTKKELGLFFPARYRIGANGAVAILRYPPDALAHSPQIEHSGAAEKSRK
jgi:hypothetical protein